MSIAVYYSGQEVLMYAVEDDVPYSSTVGEVPMAKALYIKKKTHACTMLHQNHCSRTCTSCIGIHRHKLLTTITMVVRISVGVAWPWVYFQGFKKFVCVIQKWFSQSYNTSKLRLPVLL